MDSDASEFHSGPSAGVQVYLDGVSAYPRYGLCRERISSHPPVPRIRDGLELGTVDSGPSEPWFKERADTWEKRDHAVELPLFPSPSFPLHLYPPPVANNARHYALKRIVQKASPDPL